MSESHALVSPSSRAVVASRFNDVRRLSVRQRKKWLEILLSFEFLNKYDVFDENQRAALRVEETSGGLGGFLARMFLGPIRPFEADVVDASTSQTVLQLKRRFRFIFHRLEVLSGSGEPIGTIEKEWSWFRRIYTLKDASGRPVLQIFGPFLRPWTFELRIGEKQVGSIAKRWSGLGKELFTDADNFGVDFGELRDPTAKALAFAATVLIDVVHFERNK